MLPISNETKPYFRQNLAPVPLEHFPVVLSTGLEMRRLGISAITIAGCLAILSIIFIGLAYSDGWSGGSACSMAESLCRRPSLLAIPVALTTAWGLMVLADESLP
jgi:hypothetical protein